MDEEKCGADLGKFGRPGNRPRPAWTKPAIPCFFRNKFLARQDDCDCSTHAASTLAAALPCALSFPRGCECLLLPDPGSNHMESERNFRYIAFDAVEIDLVSRRVTVADVETALEPKAFDVLALLARTPDKVFSRDEILDAVWGHRHVTPSVLNRAILLIRHALGDSARGLHTLRGIGYRFGGEVRFFSQQEKTSAITPVAGDATRTDAPAQGADEPSEVPAASVQWAAPMASTESLPLHAGDRAPPRKPAYATFLMLLAVFASTGWMLWAQRPSAHVADTA